MPKAILEFTLPEEQEEYETAQSAAKYAHQLEGLKNELRKVRKYDNLIVKPEWRKKNGEVKKQFANLVETRIQFFSDLDAAISDFLYEE
jgi:hypothetical protein